MLDERALTLRDILKGNELADLEEALSRIEAWLTSDMLPEAKGVVIFVGGRFVLPIQFAAPLPNQIVVYPTPNIYHPVEFKDNYHRYVVLLAMLEDLADRLEEINPANKTDQQTDLVMATLSNFIEHEEQESRSATQRLFEELRSQNLAVSGSAATLDVMYWGEVGEQSDVLMSLGGVGYLLRTHLNTQTARTVALG